MEKIERKEILNATDYFMNNQYDHLDLDVYNLFLDESDVGPRVELEERLRQSKSLCTGRKTKLKLKKMVGCSVIVMSDIYLKTMMLKFCSRSRTNTLLQFFVLIVFHDCENVQTSYAVSIGSTFRVYVQCYLAYSLA